MSAVTVEPTEAEFQQQVIDLAHLLGWKHLHVRRTIGLAAAGVPSYVWRPSDWPEIETALRGGS